MAGDLKLQGCHKCDNIILSQYTIYVVLTKGAILMLIEPFADAFFAKCMLAIGCIQWIFKHTYKFLSRFVPVFFNSNIEVFGMVCCKAQRDLFYIRIQPNGLYKDSYSRSPSVLNPAKIGHILLNSSRDQSGTGSHAAYPQLIPKNVFIFFLCKNGTHNL